MPSTAQCDETWSRVLRLLELDGGSISAESQRWADAARLSKVDKEDLVLLFVCERLPSLVDHAHALHLRQREVVRDVRASARIYFKAEAFRVALARAAIERLRAEFSSEAPQLSGLGGVSFGREALGSFEAALDSFFRTRSDHGDVVDISSSVQASDHGARMRVLDGFSALASALMHQGTISPIQYEALRLVLLEGVDWCDAAARLGLPDRDVRRALWECRRAFEHITNRIGR